VALRIAYTAPVHDREMLEGCVCRARFTGTIDVHDLMAAVAQRDHALEALGVLGLVVLPDLVAFGVVLASALTAHFTTVPGVRVDSAPKMLPRGGRNHLPNVRDPAGLGHQLDGQPARTDRNPPLNGAAAPMALAGEGSCGSRLPGHCFIACAICPRAQRTKQ